MPDGTNISSLWMDSGEMIDDVQINWSEIAREWWEIDWDMVGPDELVEVVAGLAQRAMEKHPNPHVPKDEVWGSVPASWKEMFVAG